MSVGVSLGVSDSEGVGLAVGCSDGESVIVVVPDIDVSALGVSVGLRVGDHVTEPVAVNSYVVEKDTVKVLDRVGSSVSDSVGDQLWELLLVTLREAVVLDVALRSTVMLRLHDAELDTVPTTVGESDADSDCEVDRDELCDVDCVVDDDAVVEGVISQVMERVKDDERETDTVRDFEAVKLAVG